MSMTTARIFPTGVVLGSKPVNVAPLMVACRGNMKSSAVSILVSPSPTSCGEIPEFRLSRPTLLMCHRPERAIPNPGVLFYEIDAPKKCDLELRIDRLNVHGESIR